MKTFLKISDTDKKNICNTCGTRYAEDAPKRCAICDDERQYVPVSGQSWTSYTELAATKTIRFSQTTDHIYSLRVTPAFGIGQKAHLIISPNGNLLWDCLPFLDEPTTAFIKSNGGLKGIAISHPHYYSLMAAWAETFDCPIYLHQADSEWVLDKSDRIVYVDGASYPLWDNMEIIHTGGHFAGSTVLYAPDVTENGSLFVGDTLQIALSRQFIAMMYSYPNIIPLPLDEILHIADQIKPLKFDSMYGAFEWQNIHAGAKEIFERSAELYKEIYKG